MKPFSTALSRSADDDCSKPPKIDSTSVKYVLVTTDTNFLNSRSSSFSSCSDLKCRTGLYAELAL